MCRREPFPAVIFGQGKLPGAQSGGNLIPIRYPDNLLNHPHLRDVTKAWGWRFCLQKGAFA